MEKGEQLQVHGDSGGGERRCGERHRKSVGCGNWKTLSGVLCDSHMHRKLMA